MSNVTMNAKEVYLPTKDKGYTITNSTIPIDASTQYKQSVKVTAQSGGSITLGNSSSLNQTSATTKFVVNNGANSKINFNSYGLCVTYAFGSIADFAVVASLSVPAPNSIADQIESIQLTFNNSSVSIYNSTGGNFVYDYTSRLITNHDWQVLNNLDTQLFTPWAMPQYESTTVTSTERWRTYTTTDAAVYGGSKLSQCQLERNARHQLLGTNDYLLRNTKVIPFCDLFPRMGPLNAIIGNLRSFELTIQWRNHSEYMETCKNNAVNGTGCLRIESCHLMGENWVMQPTQQAQEVDGKIKNEIDNIAMLTTETYTFNYVVDSDAILPSQKNVQMVHILESIYGKYNISTSLDVSGRSVGQFALFGNNNFASKTFQDHQSVYASTNKCLTSVQMEYGQDILYPNYPLTLSNGSGNVNLAPLYHEFEKALNTVGSKTARPIPFSVFSTTMPSVLFRFYPPHAPHLARESRDLVIKCKGGLATSTVHVVVYKLQVVQIHPDGSVTLNY